jgi:hypothetical protein
MVEVFYNGIDPFTGISSIPFIGVSNSFINYGQRWGNLQTITMQGTITGKCDNFSGIVAKQSQLFQNFSQDFKLLQIVQDGQTVFSGNYVKVASVDFDQSEYIGALPYKIDLNVYPAEMFTGTYGVTDPVSEIKFSEQKDRTVSITRTFSAKGFNTSSTVNNALDNARNYVQSQTGISNLVLPTFIPNVNLNASTLNPKRIQETINRMDGTYSLELSYVIREGASISTVIQYTFDIGYDDERGIYNASIKGSLSDGINGSMQNLRNVFSSLNPYNILYSRFSEVTQYNYLNPNPENFSITENEQDNILEFNYSYTSDPRNVKLDYSVDIQNEYVSDTVSVSFNGTLTARGAQAQRLTQLESALSNLDVFNLCQSYYMQKFGNSPSLPLNPNPKTYNVKRNFATSTISIQATYGNIRIPPPGFKTAKYSVSITPSINKYSPIQFLNGSNGYFDLNYYNRGKITIQGTASFDNNNDNTSIVRNYANGLMSLYSNGFSNLVKTEDKIDRNVTSDGNGYIYNFTLTQTCETPIFK